MTSGPATATLGRTGLKVTRLGYGALELMGRVGAILSAVLDAGITLSTLPTARKRLTSHHRHVGSHAKRVRRNHAP